MSYLYYLIEVNLYLTLFVLLYRIGFRKLSFFQLNRISLLLFPAIAFLIPLLDLARSAGLPLPAPDNQVNVFHNPVTAGVEQGSSTVVYCIITIYLLGVLYHLVKLLVNIGRIRQLARAYPITKADGISQVQVPASVPPFTFFRYMFISEEQRRDTAITAHEFIHIRQYHSADILYFELITALCWFNPFIRHYSTTVKELHEFIADEEASRYAPDAASYAMLLVRQAAAHPVQGALTSQIFNQSNLKNRIIMLSKDPSGRYQRIRYAFGPLLMISFIAFSAVYCSKSADTISAEGHRLNADINQEYLFTQVVEGKPITGDTIVVRAVTLEEPEVAGKADTKPGETKTIEVRALTLEELEDRGAAGKANTKPGAITIEEVKLETIELNPNYRIGIRIDPPAPANKDSQ